MNVWRFLGASTVALWLIPEVRGFTEGSMFSHMLLQFPLLIISGACISGYVPQCFHQAWAKVDLMGLTSAVFASCVGTYWMIPAALDAALINPWADLVKYASWWCSGLVLFSAWERLSSAVRLFFFGNAAWMLASVGMLYLDAESRLCVNYRFDEQYATGVGLIINAVVMGMLAIVVRKSVDPG